MKEPGKMRGGSPTRTVADWEESALSVIASGGTGALSVPDLARILGVTKGSFYWHFGSLRELLESSIRRWEESDRMTLEAIGAIGDPATRLEALFVEAMEAERAQRLYLAISLSRAPVAVTAVARVAERRLRMLIVSYRELGFSAEQAEQHGLLTYSAYVGSLHIRREGSKWLRSRKAVERYVAHAVGLLIRGKQAKRAR